jgi:hypothetical protein
MMMYNSIYTNFIDTEMSPHIHSRIHAKKYGGVPEDYLPVDELIDSSKTHMADIRHRSILHSSFGILIAEKVFGATIINMEGKKICVREIVIDHILQDLGFIPTVEQYLNNMTLQNWMSGTEKTRKSINRKHINLED